MYLKSIEIQGFKSFANRLVFEFNKGITGIVGPNGSGKSNITDAVRWVLGEQSARQLRGQKMEDVIFAGTAVRKPLGFAYVAITFDNSDHVLPLSYDTVTVSRRVFRSGESEYKINGHSCRLRDVQETFFDTGIGKEGYSIIGQGQIDKVLSGKPEDRRELFDEAAGIVKYRKRRAAAQKDLDEEEQNISRAEDIIHELQMQVEPLRVQSEKAKTYLRLRDELKTYESSMYVVSFDRLKKEGAEIEEKLGIVSSQLEDAEKEYERIKTSYDRIEELMEQYDARITALSEDSSSQAVELQRLEGARDLAGSKIESSRSDLERSGSHAAGISQQIQSKTSEIERLKTEYEDIQKEYLDSHMSSRESEEKLENVRKNIQTLKSETDSLNAAGIDCMNKMSDAKSRRARLSAEQEQSALRYSQLSSQLISLKNESDSEGDLVDAFKKEEEQIDLEIKDNAESASGLKEKITSLEAEAVKDSRALEESKRAFHEGSSRYRTLKNITERYDGYSGSIRRVMEKKDEEPGIAGVVADIIKTGRRYETAIEISLGGSISNIVTDDENTARRMISYLKKNRYGRATFLPLTTISGRRGAVDETVRSERGFIGMADELVETDERYRNIAAFLLGRIYIVDNVENAMAIARKYRFRLRIVTLEGESLNPGGSISGGAYKKTGNLLARHREMDELKEQVASLKGKMDTLASGIEETNASLNACRKEAAQLQTRREKLDLRKNTVQIRRKQVAGSREEHDRNISGIENELKALNNGLKDIESRSSAIDDEIHEYERQKEENSRKIDELAGKLDDLSDEEAGISSGNTAAVVKTSKLKERMEFSRANLDRCVSEKEELEHQLKTVLEQKDASGNMHDSLKAEYDRLSDEISRHREKIKKSSEELAAAKEEREKYAEGHKSFFDKRESLSESISALDREQVRLNARKEKIDENRKSLSDHMWEEYSLTYQSAAQAASPELMNGNFTQLKKTVSDKRNEIRELGDININSIEQFKSVSERYDTMKTQHDDLVAAREKLEGIIRSLNSSMKKQFSEKFSEINKEFGAVFASLFGGGTGTLSLADPDDLLGTGIIITAQPPGKKLQNIMQMSGGEKALTAIALLFAIQNLKPSPFCLLDEIEAALDDANVDRFAEYLHKLSDETQFIVITHRRGTMRAADVLYGITMQEKGVSTMVSVSLIEDQLSK